MARDIKSSNPFLDDDDEVDDYEFLNHPKQGYSGYMLGNTNSDRERNELEVRRMQLLEEKRKIEERTLQSTNNSLGLLDESEKVGILTAEELLKQREQLQNIEENLDTINNTMRTSQKHINSLKSIFGGIKNYFSKSNTPDPSLRQPEIVSARKPPSALHDTMGNLRTDSKINEIPHPALKLRGISYDDDDEENAMKSTTVRSPTRSSTRFPSDIDSKIDENLDHLSMGLGRLKNLAIGLHDEIETQNDMIDAIHNKADKADETLEYQNRQIKRILKK